MLIVNGEGTIATVFKKNKIKNKNPLQKCVDYFATRNIKFKNIKYFGGKGSFNYKKTKLSHPSLSVKLEVFKIYFLVLE